MRRRIAAILVSVLLSNYIVGAPMLAYASEDDSSVFESVDENQDDYQSGDYAVDDADTSMNNDDTIGEETEDIENISAEEDYTISENDVDISEIELSVSENEIFVSENEIEDEGEDAEDRGIEVEYKINSKWQGAASVLVIITNNTDDTLHNWGLSFECDDTFVNVYNAQLLVDEGSCLFKSKSYNQDIKPGESVYFGFTQEFDEDIDSPDSFEVLSVEKLVDNRDVSVYLATTSEWEEHALVQLVITNESSRNIKDWRCSFDANFEIEQIWDGEIVSESGRSYVIKNPDYSQNIESGESTSACMIVKCDTIPEVRNISVYEVANDKVDESVSDNTVSDNSISENTVSENTVSDNSVSDNTVSDNTISENTISSNDIEKSLEEGDVSTYIEATGIVSDAIIEYIREHDFEYEDADLIVEFIKENYPNLVREARVSSGNTIFITLTSGFEYSFQVVDTSDMYAMCRGGMPSMAMLDYEQESEALIQEETSELAAQVDDRIVRETGSDKILLWAPFDSVWKDADETEIVGAIVDDSDYAGKLTIVSDEEADADSMRSFSEYGLIIIATHGSEGKWIVTGEEITDVEAHSAEVVEGTMSEAVVYDLFTDSFNKRWQVNDVWISKNVGAFCDSIVINNSCESSKDMDLANTFLGLGARTYYGYSANVTNQYIMEQSSKVLKGLLQEGLTTEESYDITVDTTYDGGAMEIYGYGNVVMPRKIESTIYNHSFEADGEGWSINADGGSSEGYCTFLSSLYGITPTDGNRMVALGTDNKAYGYSCIEQTVAVPEDASYIYFDYNMLEAYDPERISDGIINIEHGNVVTLDIKDTNSYKSEAHDWYTIPNTQTKAVRLDNDTYSGFLIEMPDAVIQGCDNVYMTDWQTASYDVSEYAGKTIKLKLYVLAGWYYAGAVESLVLIDNVRLDYEQKLSPAIRNTSFEDDMIGWNVDSYSYAGRRNPSKSLVMGEYAGIKPTDGNKMLAMITNEDNNADIYVYQTIYIPKNAAAITFDYNILDSFDAERFNTITSGSILYVRQDKEFNYVFDAYNRPIYNSCEHYGGGREWGSTPLIYAEDVAINGYENVYMSGWQQGVYDVSKLAESTVEFQISFSNSGGRNGANASVILLDNIRFVYEDEGEGFVPVSDEYASQIVRDTVSKAKSRLVSKRYLIDIGWKAGNVTDEEVDKLNDYLRDNGITNTTSIIFFLATALHESARGTKTVEVWDDTKQHSYEYNNRGVGYIQLTGLDNHSQFLEAQKESNDNWTSWDTTMYIDENYDPWLVSVYFWSTILVVGKEDKISINDYICMRLEGDVNLEGLFMVVQYYVNGFLEDKDLYDEETGQLLENPVNSSNTSSEGSYANTILAGIRTAGSSWSEELVINEGKEEIEIHITTNRGENVYFRGPIGWQDRKSWFERCYEVLGKGIGK